MTQGPTPEGWALLGRGPSSARWRTSATRPPECSPGTQRRPPLTRHDSHDTKTQPAGIPRPSGTRSSRWPRPPAPKRSPKKSWSRTLQVYPRVQKQALLRGDAALRPGQGGCTQDQQERMRLWRCARSAVRESAVGPVPAPSAVPSRTGRTLLETPSTLLWREDCSVGSGEESRQLGGWCCVRSTDRTQRTLSD